MVLKSDLKVKISKSFFKGNRYLVEASFDNQFLYFESFKDIEKEKSVFLALKKTD